MVRNLTLKITGHRVKVYQISISDNEISQYYRELSEPTWWDHDHEVVSVEAITPATEGKPPHNWIKFNKKDFKVPHRDHTPTERSIFYSYLKAIQMIADSGESGIVCEHDTELLHYIPKLLLLDLEWSLLGHQVAPTGRLVKLACTAMYMTSPMAKWILEQPIWKTGVKHNVDGVLENLLSDISHDVSDPRQPKISKVKNIKYCRQIVHAHIGTTIEHGKEHVSLFKADGKIK
jgi:hypothetical protein